MTRRMTFLIGGMWIVLSLWVSAQQPLLPRVQTTPPDVLRQATTWTVTTDGIDTTLPVMIAQGPAFHLRSLTTPQVARSATHVSGSFTIRAAFAPEGSALVSYGFTLGSQISRTDFLVRSDGHAAVVPRGTSPSWLPLPDNLKSPATLQVRVVAGRIEFVIDGAIVETIQATPGALDGPVGIYVGPAADVRVSGIVIERTLAGGIQ